MPGMGVPIRWLAQTPSLPQWFSLHAIRRNPRLPQNFSASPLSPAWERAESSGQVTSAMWNCFRERKMSWHLQSA